jgi:CHAD domain-containing protein
LFRVFEPVIPANSMQRFSGRLRDLARCLGEARNLDVFATQTLPRAGSFQHSGMKTLRRRTLLARRTASRAARAAIGDRAYPRTVLELARLLSGDALSGQASASVPVMQFAGESLDRLLKKARKRARGLNRLGYAELHRLRIALKRLRYAMEFFEPLWSDGMQGMLESLGELQDGLGRLNDDATAWKLLDALAVQNAEPDYQQAVGFVRGWSAQDAERCREGLADAWKRFARLKPAWR